MTGPAYSLFGFIILLTKATAAQNEDTLSYHTVRGLYFLAVVFVGSIFTDLLNSLTSHDLFLPLISHYLYTNKMYIIPIFRIRASISILFDKGAKIMNACCFLMDRKKSKTKQLKRCQKCLYWQEYVMKE